MPTQFKIAIAIIGFIAIIFVVGFFIWMVILPGPQQPARPQNQYSGGSTGQTTVTTPGATVVPPVDIEKENRVLFEKLSARKVEFISVGTSTGKFADIYALYATDIATAKHLFPKEKSFPIEVASVDLNGDAMAEVIVYESLPGFCGSAGCPFDVYKKENNTWRALLNTLAYETVGTLPVVREGYLDLLILVHGDVGYLSNAVRFGWDGKQYQGLETLAQWNGSTFNFAQ